MENQLLEISGAEAGLAQKRLQRRRKMVELGHGGICFINSTAVNLQVITEDCKTHRWERAKISMRQRNQNKKQNKSTESGVVLP